MLIGADATAACCSLALAYLLWHDRLETWHIYLANAVASVMNAVQWPAFATTTSLLIPAEQRVRVAAVSEALPAVSMLLSPAIAGAVLAWGGLELMFFAEFATFLFASAITLSVPFPTTTSSLRGALVSSGQTVMQDMLNDTRTAWLFIWSRPGLLGLIVLLALGQLSSGAVQVLMMPLILSFAPPSTLGSVLTLSGLGALAGAALLSVTNVPEAWRATTVLVAFFFQGLLLAGCGLFPNSSVILAVAFGYMAMIPVSRACRVAIWQCKTPTEMQGRVFALQKGLQQFSLPLAAVLAGPLADIAEPLLLPGGVLEDTAGAWIGVGPGRGAALLFILLGLGNALTALLAACYVPLRMVDTLLPDAVLEEVNHPS